MRAQECRSSTNESGSVWAVGVVGLTVLYCSRDVETERAAPESAGSEEAESGQPGEDGGPGQESHQESNPVPSSGASRPEGGETALHLADLETITN